MQGNRGVCETQWKQRKRGIAVGNYMYDVYNVKHLLSAWTKGARGARAVGGDASQKNITAICITKGLSNAARRLATGYIPRNVAE